VVVDGSSSEFVLGFCTLSFTFTPTFALDTDDYFVISFPKDYFEGRFID
jgi:hypothetical protein